MAKSDERMRNGKTARPASPTGHAPHTVASVAPTDADDSAVVAALRQYSRQLERNEAPSREEFLARNPRIAKPLAAALDSLLLMNHVASGVKRLPPLKASAEPFEPTLPLGDFRIIREIGRGGMGIVYEAEQLSLGRRVALKVLPFAAALDAKQLARFKNEAHAAAHLHHSNIVPVFAVGSDRGVHYYAMQFIEGQTLADFIRERRQQERALGQPRNGGKGKVDPSDLSDSSSVASPAHAPGPAEHSSSASNLVKLQSEDSATLPFAPGQRARSSPAAPKAAVPNGGSTRIAENLSTKLAGRGLDYYKTLARLALQAADALEYAHSMGVVHRDIKPANMLIDHRGVLWVTDFGLAHFRRSGELTVSGDLLGTARYMSPEQTRGERARVDHHTDIYSLGVTLYELFTQRHAFDGKGWNELMRQIAHEEPPTPRKVRADLPPEFDIIIQKAMSKNPLDRYATAAGLAEDLRRFLDDRPILAKRPTLVQVANKWIRRHRAVLGTAVVLLVVAFAALSWFYWRLYEESQATHQAYQTSQVSRSLAREAVDTMYTEFAEKWLKDHPQLQKVQLDFLLRARDYYAQFAHEHGNEPAVRHRRAIASCRVAEIEHMFSKDPKHETALTRSANAYQDALRTLRQLIAEFPLQFDYQVDLARALNGQGLLQLDAWELAKALESFESALEIDRRLGAYSGRTDRFLVRRDLAIHQGNLGRAHLKLRQYPQARESMQASLELLTQLQKEWQEVIELRKLEEELNKTKLRECRLSLEPETARVQLHLGMLCHETGKYAEASLHWNASLDLSQRLAEDFPYEFKFKSIQAQSLKLIGQRCYEDGQYRAADEVLRKALALNEQLTASLELPNQRRELAGCLALLARVAKERGRPQEAAQYYRGEIDLWARLCAAGEADRTYLGIAKNNLGHVLLDLQQAKEAEDAFRDALMIESERQDRFAAPPHDRHRMAIYNNNKAKALWQMGRTAEAEDLFRNAVETSDAVVSESLTRCDYKPVEYRAAAATLHRNFAQFLIQQGRLAEAERELKSAMAQELRLRSECEHDAKWPVLCAQSHLRLASLYERQRQPGLASRHYFDAHSLLVELAEARPEHPDALNRLAWFLANCPDPQHRDLARARHYAELALKTETRVDATLPDAYRTLGLLSIRQGDFCSAIVHLEQAKRLRDRPDPIALLLLAQAYARKGDLLEALGCQLEALVENRKRANADDEEFVCFQAELREAIFPSRQRTELTE